jgi:hypothetical protein
MNATATTEMPQQQEALRTNLLCLLETCPADLCNSGDCPLYPLRQMNYAERLEWFNGLSEADLAYLAAYHAVCFELKLTEQLLAANWHPAASGPAVSTDPARSPPSPNPPAPATA